MENKSKKNQIEDFLTDYETRVYHGYKKTVADKLKDRAMFKTAVKNRLAMEEQVKLPTGEVVTVTAMELLIDKKLQDDLEHPESIDLTKWLKIAGEDVTQVEANVRGADELFGDIVNKTEQ